MTKRTWIEAIGLAALIGLAVVQWNEWTKAGLLPQKPVVQVIYRDKLMKDERVVVEPCVPVERVVKVQVAGVSGGPVDSLDTSDRTNPSSMFPLYMGQLSLDRLPYGGKLGLSLVDNGSGVGVPKGDLIPNPRPRFEWLFDPSVGVGAGGSFMGGPAVGAAFHLDLLRYKALTLSFRVEGDSTLRDGSDVRAMVWGNVPLGSRD